MTLPIPLNVAVAPAIEPQTVPGLPATPSTAQIERFNAVMQADSASSAPGLAAVQASTEAPKSILNLGEQILGKLQHTSGELQTQWQHITNNLNTAHTAAKPNVSHLLHTQAQLLQVSVHYELISKAVSKATQNVDSMVKMQ